MLRRCKSFPTAYDFYPTGSQYYARGLLNTNKRGFLVIPIRMFFLLNKHKITMLRLFF